MNKNLQKVLTGVLALTLVAALAGCGGNSTEEPSADTQEETTAEEATTDTQEETSALEEYTSGDGWTVQYDPSLIEVEEGGGAVDFLYLGESEGTNMVTISYEADKQPEEVLYELTSTWGNDEDIDRSEGFFPGTDDQWGFWRSIAAPEDNSMPSRTAIAGEYNGGVLLFQETISLTGDDAIDTEIAGALETIVDSVTYEDFQPQTMFDYVPGTYTATQDGATGTITLNEDHTGVISFQDDVDILWGSIELSAVDNSFQYEYTIEGDSLHVNYDGEWMELSK